MSIQIDGPKNHILRHSFSIFGLSFIFFKSQLHINEYNNLYNLAQQVKDNKKQVNVNVLMFEQYIGKREEDRICILLKRIHK
jgi:hypothetical protein